MCLWFFAIKNTYFSQPLDHMFGTKTFQHMPLTIVYILRRSLRNNMNFNLRFTDRLNIALLTTPILYSCKMMMSIRVCLKSCLFIHASILYLHKRLNFIGHEYNIFNFVSLLYILTSHLFVSVHASFDAIRCDA